MTIERTAKLTPLLSDSVPSPACFVVPSLRKWRVPAAINGILGGEGSVIYLLPDVAQLLILGAGVGMPNMTTFPTVIRPPRLANVNIFGCGISEEVSAIFT